MVMIVIVVMLMIVRVVVVLLVLPRDEIALRRRRHVRPLLHGMLKQHVHEQVHRFGLDDEGPGGLRLARVEVLVPLRDEMLRQRVHHEILDAYLADNRKARILLRDATYIPAWQPARGARNRRPPVGAAAFSAQDFLMSVADGKSPSVVPVPVPARRRRVKGMVGKER